MTSTLRCPCGSGETYPNCCGRFHSGLSDAPTAKALMQSRFSAFAVGDESYLLATWHRSTRPARLELDSGTRWTRLDIVQTLQGGPFDTQGVVEFDAHYRSGTQRGVQHERSLFTRERQRWFYLSGENL
ncbi:YchJ family protein [Jatrophihabitans sp. GAS493]|uniref:YchJ family protein n=1 Tax=Jatrophihabitans sp. GAS493 TaxID=1907575 RepID=UPI000BB6DE1A|nr:YchJ family protein [Jatrophihabitans sp. GAS493]